jgi:N-methylhydantoinase A/oxoprolinase/acetone carboxylase beta subunit
LKKKTYVIACAVLAVDMKQVAENMGRELSFQFLEAGLHNNPDKLKTKLQAAIDKVSAKRDADRIIIGYGICGKGTIGIQARQIPLIIPKVHDCIALFLGGDNAYKSQFEKYPGTYYLSAGWCKEESEYMSHLNQRTWFGSQELEFENIEKVHGTKAAQTTFDFLNTWQQNYQRVAYIETGAGNSQKDESYARKIAQEYQWKYEKIKGNQGFIKRMLTTEASTGVSSEKSGDEILVVPPEHVIGFDPITASLSANPILQKEEFSGQINDEIREEHDSVYDKRPCSLSSREAHVKIGLGIDAGGTYTDAVIYDLNERTTLCKAKSLTTKWDFTIGIAKAIEKLDQKHLLSVELVALSTTLATNAIVENQGQKVGLILMPPNGFTGGISHDPQVVIQGQLDISGVERQGLDPHQIKRVADRMIHNQSVSAFAVSGYAGSVNPCHEQAVKTILEAHTGFFVSCGHELSDTLNFNTRAVTAMLNAKIIPRLTALLSDLDKVMNKLGIKAPVVVVKGDGTLMDSSMAKQRPVETILSGPAASVAGARHLTGIGDALVVDMGGTTTDTAALCRNEVSLAENGSRVGGHRTHVKALDIRTTGLGGDSRILFEKGKFSLGPVRVVPIAYLSHIQPKASQAIEYLEQHLNKYTSSTWNMQVIMQTGSKKIIDLTPLEKSILNLLSQRPYSIDELVHKTDVLSEISLPLARLEENFLIQRCGLTPTDLLHLIGKFTPWDKEASLAYASLFSTLSNISLDQMIEKLLQSTVNALSIEILKRQLDDKIHADDMDSCPVCQLLLDNLLCGSNKEYSISMSMKRPVIGIGAPIKYFLSRAVKPLGTRALLPEDADVANAIGAITSHVMIKKQLRIIPGELGGFIVEGVPGTNHFKDFDLADAFARDELTRLIRKQALFAGTSCNKVTLKTRDQVSKTAFGEPVFMARTIEGSLTGPPDLVRNRTLPGTRKKAEPAPVLA